MEGAAAHHHHDDAAVADAVLPWVSPCAVDVEKEEGYCSRGVSHRLLHSLMLKNDDDFEDYCFFLDLRLDRCKVMDSLFRNCYYENIRNLTIMDGNRVLLAALLLVRCIRAEFMAAPSSQKNQKSKPRGGEAGRK